jgi:GNAT superfamily N-acetyltransferase
LAKSPPGTWVIEKLERRHDRSPFDCGEASLNDWLKLRAGQYERKDLARIYVAVRAGNSLVVGYYAIATHQVAYEVLTADQAKGLPRMDVPVVLLGRLAVDRSVHGQGLGSLLLVDALRRTESLADEIGIRAVEVDAIDDAASAFYIRFGFTPLADDPRHLYLPIQAIRRMGLAAPAGRS